MNNNPTHILLHIIRYKVHNIRITTDWSCKLHPSKYLVEINLIYVLLAIYLFSIKEIAMYIFNVKEEKKDVKRDRKTRDVLGTTLFKLFLLMLIYMESQ